MWKWQLIGWWMERYERDLTRRADQGNLPVLSGPDVCLTGWKACHVRQVCGFSFTHHMPRFTGVRHAQGDFGERNGHLYCVYGFENAID